MPFKQVTEQDLKGKGVIGQPAVPGLSVTEMQKSVEQVVREAAIPAHNQLCEELEAEAAAADIGAAVPGSGDIPPETPKKLQSVLEAMLVWAKERLGLKADNTDTYTKRETDEKISEGITDTGFEEAVQQAKQSAEEAKGYAESIDPAQFAQATEGVPTVNASKAQNAFDIELPSSNQFVMIPDSPYVLGDTFKISGRAVAARMPNGDTLPDGFFEAGAKVLCLWEDDLLYFNGGGSAPKNTMRYRLDDGTPAQPPAPINADTLQGHNAEYFATAAGLEALAAQAVMPYKAGDSYSFSSFDTGGFITGNARNGYFHIPLWKPVIASAVSVTGSCRIRQGGKYLFGTSDDKADISSLKVESLIKEGYIYFKLTKEDGFTDAINNDACAIDLDATITFGEAT